jgi:hypothetical protein
MRIGITATRHLTEVGQRHIEEAMREAVRLDVEGIIVGGAVGGDAYAGLTAHALRLWVKVILPEDAKEADPDFHRYADEAEGRYPYRERNTRIVQQCTDLWAFPAYLEADPRSKRSGTWMTVRIARQMGRPVRLWVQEPPSSRLDRRGRGGTDLTKRV